MANKAHERIAAEWQEYREAGLPNEVPVDILESFQATFYSGALVMFDLLMASARMSGDDTEAAIVLTLTLKRELDAYFDALRQEVSRGGDGH